MQKVFSDLSLEVLKTKQKKDSMVKFAAYIAETVQ